MIVIGIICNLLKTHNKWPHCLICLEPLMYNEWDRWDHSKILCISEHITYFANYPENKFSKYGIFWITKEMERKECCAFFV